MDPDHNSLAPSRPTQTKRLTPKLTLIATNTLDLLCLLLLAALDVLVVARDPLMLAGLVHKLHAVLLERRHGVQREVAILGDQLGGARDYHRRDRFVALEEVLYLLRRDGDEVCFNELGVLDDGAGVDDGGERFCREVSSVVC
jgi:hypothetical protein